MEIDLEKIRRRKCTLCGDYHKSIANIMSGQNHIATVTVCCNCGFTATFAHSASEYVKYLEDGNPSFNTEVCPDMNTPSCLNRNGCPKIEKGRKI